MKKFWNFIIEMLRFLVDPYELKARLRPALLCGFSLLVSVVLLIPEVGEIWAMAGGIILYCGGTIFLAHITRDRGTMLEPKLYEVWGGKPSVAMLRHSDTRLNVSTKNRYREFLQCAVPGLMMASPEEEHSNPEKTEEGYESANSWLLAQTRDRTRFGLLFRENISYGFRRNLLALRPWAFGLNVIAITIAGTVASVSWTGEFLATICMIDLKVWTSIMLSTMHAFFFGFKIHDRWVQPAAEAYARQLLATCDILASERAN